MSFSWLCINILKQAVCRKPMATLLCNEKRVEALGQILTLEMGLIIKHMTA